MHGATAGAAWTALVLAAASVACGGMSFYLSLAAVIVGTGALMATRQARAAGEHVPLLVVVPAALGVAVGALRLALFAGLVLWVAWQSTAG